MALKDCSSSFPSIHFLKLIYVLCGSSSISTDTMTSLSLPPDLPLLGGNLDIPNQAELHFYTPLPLTLDFLSPQNYDSNLLQ